MKLRLGIIALVLLAAVFFARNFLARQTLEKYLAARTGLPVHVGQATLGLTSCSLALRNVRLSKGEEAAGERLVEFDRLDVDTRLKPLLTKNLRVESMTVELAYLHLIRHADGTTNLQTITRQLVSGKHKPGAGKAPTLNPSGSGPGPAAEAPSWIIDKLNLHINQIEITDYARGSTPTQLTLTLNTSRTYRNISSMDQVLQPLKDEFLSGILGETF